MNDRPSKAVIRLELLALAIGLGVAALFAGRSDWDLPVLGILVALAIVSDLRRVSVPSNRIFASASFLAIITVAVLLGSAAGVLAGVLTISVGWLKERYPKPDLLINLVTYVWFPIVSGRAIRIAGEALGVGSEDAEYSLLVLGAFVLGLAVNFLAITAYSAYLERARLATKLRRVLVPVLPTEFATALLAVGLVYAYMEIGITAIALAAILLLTFQYLLGELLVSQERADELEVRAKQLAGFQVALLSALLRTLDLRDRMTARHSAAVARYSRELAARAGLSEADQELAHTAGLLHDIGKFVLPDTVLKKGGRLEPDDWEQIQRHPYEGARIVSQIDGYSPVGEIILAHHERIDGLGYPRALVGEEIPEVARIIAVGDSYDAMTARDSYRSPLSSFEAIAELRRVSGTQLDGRFVELFIQMLGEKDLAYRHGEDADFEAELALDKRIHDYVAGSDL